MMCHHPGHWLKYWPQHRSQGCSFSYQLTSLDNKALNVTLWTQHSRHFFCLTARPSSPYFFSFITRMLCQTVSKALINQGILHPLLSPCPHSHSFHQKEQSGWLSLYLCMINPHWLFQLLKTEFIRSDTSFRLSINIVLKAANLIIDKSQRELLETSCLPSKNSWRIHILLVFLFIPCGYQWNKWGLFTFPRPVLLFIQHSPSTTFQTP